MNVCKHSDKLAGRIERAESLRWVGQRTGKGDVGAYLVQIADKPGEVTVFEVFFMQSILPLKQCVDELSAKVG